MRRTKLPESKPKSRVEAATMGLAPLIHIGVHKTATSWFQADFYPRVRNARYINRVAVRQVLLGGNGYRFDAAAARETLGFDEGDRAILCDEDLSGVLHNGGVATTFLAAAIADRLHAASPDAEIVIFVREQVAMAAACYHQYVREGGTASARRYLFPENYRHLTKMRPFKTPRFDFAQFDYRGLIERYDALFGRDRVHVFAYEEFARDRPGFLDKFTRRLSLDIDLDSLLQRRVNASYRSGTLALARFFNLFTERSVADKRMIVHIPYWYPARKAVLRQLDRLPLGGRPDAERLIGNDTTAFIRGEFAPMNRWLAERTQTDLVALGYAFDSPSVLRPTRAAWLRALRN